MTIPPLGNEREPRDPSHTHAQTQLPEETLTGVLVASVEGDSAILRTIDSSYNLGAAGRDLLGHRVRVRGRQRPDIMTIEQQGVVFSCEHIEDLGLAD